MSLLRISLSAGSLTFPRFGASSPTSMIDLLYALPATTRSSIKSQRELSRIAFHLGQRAAEDGFLLTLSQRFLEQAAQAVLLPLNPQEILNLLPRSCARNFRIQKHASPDLVALEPTHPRQALEASDMLFGKPRGESMLQISHTKIMNIAIALSRKKVTSDARISRRR